MKQLKRAIQRDGFTGLLILSILMSVNLVVAGTVLNLYFYGTGIPGFNYPLFLIFVAVCVYAFKEYYSSGKE